MNINELNIDGLTVCWASTQDVTGKDSFYLGIDKNVYTGMNDDEIFDIINEKIFSNKEFRGYFENEIIDDQIIFYYSPCIISYASTGLPLNIEDIDSIEQ